MDLFPVVPCHSLYPGRQSTSSAGLRQRPQTAGPSAALGMTPRRAMTGENEDENKESVDDMMRNLTGEPFPFLLK